MCFLELYPMSEGLIHTTGTLETVGIVQIPFATLQLNVVVSCPLASASLSWKVQTLSVYNKAPQKVTVS